MTIKKILTEPNKILRQISEPVEKVGIQERELMRDMLETMYSAKGIGLAAIQIGIPKRIIVMDLSKEDDLSGSQIRRFLILHKELDADAGELTRTRKVRRSAIAGRYTELIDALYSDRTHCPVDASVTFEDGRTGSIKADLQIHDIDTISVPLTNTEAA